MWVQSDNLLNSAERAAPEQSLARHQPTCAYTYSKECCDVAMWVQSDNLLNSAEIGLRQSSRLLGTIRHARTSSLSRARLARERRNVLKNVGRGLLLDGRGFAHRPRTLRNVAMWVQSDNLLNPAEIGLRQSSRLLGTNRHARTSSFSRARLAREKRRTGGGSPRRPKIRPQTTYSKECCDVVQSDNLLNSAEIGLRQSSRLLGTIRHARTSSFSRARLAREKRRTGGGLPSTAEDSPTDHVL